MVQSSERLAPPSRERTAPQRLDRDPLQFDEEVEAQRTVFTQQLDHYRQQLTGKELHTEVPTLLKQVLENTANHNELAVAADFFALVTAVEAARSPRHSANWEQAAAAMHIVFPYRSGEVQRILMATGEGKTFTIAMAALWKAKHGQRVTVHTDKKANVEQSFRGTQQLYELFEVTSSKVQTAEEVGPAYLNTLNVDTTQVRYGVWSQFMHEHLTRQSIIFEAESLLRGDLALQRQGIARVADPAAVRQLIDHHQKYLVPDCVISDEGDVSVDLESSPVVLSQENAEGFTPIESAQLELAWQLFADQDPTALQRIAKATHFSIETVTEKYEVKTITTVEGTDQEADQVLAVNKNRVMMAPEALFFAKLFEMTATPAQLSEVLRLAQLSAQSGELSLAWPPETINRLIEVLAHPTEGVDSIDWTALGQVLPPVQKSELRHYFSAENKLINYHQFLTQHPEVRAALSSADQQLQEGDWQVIQQAFGAEFPVFQQRLTFVRLLNAVQQVCEPLFIHHNHDAMNVKYVLEEGNDYIIDRTGQEAQIIVLSNDRQPQPGKQFTDSIQAFLQLKHDLPLAVGQETIGQIMPITWYHSRAKHGAEVTSISGTQENPDYVVESTGQSEVIELPARVFENNEQKLRAITKYVQSRADVPILLCAEDYGEWKALADALAGDPERELILLDADHADDSYELVQQLSKGKILLLQITARGLDFGKLTEQMQHSFADGVIVGAGPLLDKHQEDQRRGRLGNKRPQGKTVLFTSLDDEVAQQFYLISPQTSEQRHQRMQAIQSEYEALIATDQLRKLNWPASFAEADAELAAWFEDDDRAEAERQPRSMPTWMQVLINDPAISAEMQPIAQKLAHRFGGLFKQYEALRQGHLSSLERQQQNNLRKTTEQRREQMTVDVVVQNLWQTIMNPTESTPLGKVVLPLTYEERKRLMVQVFEDANSIYTLSKLQVKPDDQESVGRRQERRMNQFIKDFSERIIDWVEGDQLLLEYQRLQTEFAPLFPAPLPNHIEQLSAWLETHFPVVRQSPWRRVTQHVLLGLQLYAQPDRLPMLPAEVNPTLTDQVVEQLRQLSKRDQQIRRKFQAEK